MSAARSGALGGLAVGGVFGAGLVLSGMTDPARVRAFLDLGGGWDPRLALVMVGAIAVHGVTRRWILRRPAPLLGGGFPPARAGVDRLLVGGAALFGVAWGVSGWCPGPALVAAGSGSVAAAVFVVGMAIGMSGAGFVRQRLPTQPSLGDEATGPT